ncbi:MAG: glycerophosphodiester phosphodiesterase family protein [Proteobacteria bacterium]|nr:glycerophosphodiester phosphodiesterase family protein [Pseudomonadota bacterium]
MSPRLVCHRGASLIAPENTFAAADAALEKGAHLIELDVRESADGVLYVLHDQTLDRTTDGTGPIQYRSAAEIDVLDAGRWFGPEFEGQRVPRLDAYLDHLHSRGAGAYVEIKWCNADSCAAILRETGMIDACFSFSFKTEMRTAMRAAAPDLRQMITLSIARNVSVARSLYGADLIEIEAAECQRAVIAAAHAAGLEIMGYTETDDPAIFRRYVEAGLDYINHDHLEVALSVLEDRA